MAYQRINWQRIPTHGNRVHVEARILSAKQVMGYHPGDLQTRCLIDATVDGQHVKLWGTVPYAVRCVAGVTDEALRGVRWSFDARLKPKADDPLFGYYKNPTKVVVHN